MKTRAAEWILSQVLPTENARAAIGDWLEDTPKHGDFWFWCCVIRTIVARIASGFYENPFGLVGLALRAIVFNLLIFCRCFFLNLIAAVPLLILAGFLIHFRVLSSPQFDYALHLGGRLLSDACLLTCAYKTGKWVASRTPGHELTGCATFLVVEPLFFGLLAAAVMHFWGTPAYADQVLIRADQFPVGLAENVAILAGALKTRSGSQRCTPC